MRLLQHSIFINLILSFALGCSVEPQDNENAEKDKRTKKATETPNVPRVVKPAAQVVDNPKEPLPQDGDESGMYLVGRVSGDIPLSGIKIRIVGHDASASTESDGSFKIANAGLGDKVSLYATTKHKGQTYGGYTPDVTVDGKELSLTDSGIDMPLSLSGTIAGTIQLANAKTHIGTSVYLPGTSFQAKTDDDGKFQMQGIPAGIWPKVQIEHEGYVNYAVQDVEVKSSETTTIDDTKLLIDLEVNAGSVTLAGGSLVSKIKEVKVELEYPEQVTRMMVSEEKAFVDKKWTEVAAEFNHTFSSNGNQTLYVKFASADGLESSPISATIYIDSLSSEEKKAECEKDASKIYYQGACVDRTFFHDCLNPKPEYAPTVKALKEVAGTPDCQKAYEELKIRTEAVDLASKGIVDITPFRGILTKVEELNLSGNKVSDLAPIAPISGLKKLNLNSNLIEDTSPLRTLLKLESLEIAHNMVSTFKGLAVLNIHSLTIGGQLMSNLSDLPTVDSIRELTIVDTVFEDAQFAPLASMPGIKVLTIKNQGDKKGKATNLSFIEHMPNIEELTVEHHSLSDISKLGHAKKIRSVNLAGNQIVDASSVPTEKLKTLILADNKIKTLPKFEANKVLEVVNISNNEVADISNFKDAEALREVTIHGNSIYGDLSMFAKSTKLAKFSYEDGRVYDAFCPKEGAGAALMDYCKKAGNSLKNPEAAMEVKAKHCPYDRYIDVEWKNMAGNFETLMLIEGAGVWMVDGKEATAEETYVSGKTYQVRVDCAAPKIDVSFAAGSSSMIAKSADISWGGEEVRVSGASGYEWIYGPLSDANDSGLHAMLRQNVCYFPRFHNGFAGQGGLYLAIPFSPSETISVSEIVLGMGYGVYGHFYSSRYDKETERHVPDRRLHHFSLSAWNSNAAQSNTTGLPGAANHWQYLFTTKDLAFGEFPNNEISYKLIGDEKYWIVISTDRMAFSEFAPSKATQTDFGVPLLYTLSVNSSGLTDTLPADTEFWTLPSSNKDPLINSLQPKEGNSCFDTFIPSIAVKR